MLFTAALLKDIGKIVLGSFGGDFFEKIWQLVSEKGYSFPEAEKEVFSIDHAILGGMIADKWNFSGRMAHIIRYHHDPLQGIHADYDTATVYLADIVSIIVGPYNGSDGIVDRFYDTVLKKLGYSGYDIYRLMAEYHEKIQKAINMLTAAESAN